jgi:IPT/TIG domain
MANLAGCVLLVCTAAAQTGPPTILAISPTHGPEGARVEISGKNLAGVSKILFGATPAVFEAASSHKLIAIVPHRVASSIVTVVTPQGQGRSPFAFVVSNDPRIPDEVSYKAACQLRFSAAVEYRDCGHAGAGPRIGAGGNCLDPAVVPGRR